MQLNRIIVFILLACSTTAFGQASLAKKAEEVCYNPNAKGDTSKRSIKSAAMGKIGKANITIIYHSPGVRNRTIWGGLVPYDDVWVTGAHNATILDVDKDFVVAGTSMPKGKYGLFTIPGKEEWTVILNKNWEQHLTDDYLQKEDVVRLTVEPVLLNEKVERLQYFIEDGKDGEGRIAVTWELLRIQFDIKTQQ